MAQTKDSANFLLDHGANINPSKDRGPSPLEMRVRRLIEPNIVNTYLRHGASTNIQKILIAPTALMFAAGGWI